MMIGTLPPLESQKFAERLAWAEAVHQGFLAGKYTDREAGWIAWNRIVGWTDIGHTAQEKRQLLAVAGQLATLLHQLFPR